MSNEQAVRRTVDGMPGLIITATAAGATQFANQQLLAYFGKTLDEALNGWAIFDAVHPERNVRMNRGEAVYQLKTRDIHRRNREEPHQEHPFQTCG